MSADLARELLNSAGGIIGLAAGLKWGAEWWTRRQSSPRGERELSKRPELERLRAELDAQRTREAEESLRRRQREDQLEVYVRELHKEITRITGELGELRAARDVSMARAAALEAERDELLTRVAALESRIEQLIEQLATYEADRERSDAAGRADRTGGHRPAT